MAFRGGASEGLKYFKVVKELYNKNIFPEYLSGSSAGGIFAACIACIRNPDTIKELMKDIQGDRVMKLSCKIEDDKTPKIKKIIYFFLVLFFKTITINSIENIFKKYLTWERAKFNNVKFLAIGVVKQSDVIKTYGRDIFKKFKRGNIDNTDFRDTKESTYKLIRTLPMYFFTNDGVYRYNYMGYKKISDKIVPLWKAVMATFANPILPAVKLKFNKWYPQRALDGGMANTYANTSLTIHKNFIQVSCTNIPGELTLKETGFKNINKLYYNIHRAKEENELIVKSKNKYKGFFAFYDQNIDDYANEEPTNFFKNITDIY